MYVGLYNYTESGHQRNSWFKEPIWVSSIHRVYPIISLLESCNIIYVDDFVTYKPMLGKLNSRRHKDSNERSYNSKAMSSGESLAVGDLEYNIYRGKQVFSMQLGSPHN